MCGRFSLELNETFYPRYEITNRIEIRPNYNVAPYSFIPVIVKKSPKKVIEMKWGFIPSWSKDFSTKYAMINTRAETIDEKPYFKTAFNQTRCLIPATGFYEWKDQGKEKIPFYIHLKNNSYFSFAGIYSVLKNDKGEDIFTCSIITTKPNELMENIHDRMPVILSKNEEETWLDETIEDEYSLKSLLDPYPSDELEAYRVSKDVNSPRNNGEELLKRI